MGSPINPDNIISQGYQYANFQKTEWMTIVHLPRFRIKHWKFSVILNFGTCIIHIDTVLEGFAYPCETRYADFAWVCGTHHLKICTKKKCPSLKEKKRRGRPLIIWVGGWWMDSQRRVQLIFFLVLRVPALRIILVWMCPEVRLRISFYNIAPHPHVINGRPLNLLFATTVSLW